MKILKKNEDSNTTSYTYVIPNLYDFISLNTKEDILIDVGPRWHLLCGHEKKSDIS